MRQTHPRHRVKDHSRTLDGSLFRPGMVLYGECEGVVTEIQTSPYHCDIPGYALVENHGVPFISISAHFAFESFARQAAANFAIHSQKVAAGWAEGRAA